jgi:cell division control protein 12
MALKSFRVYFFTSCSVENENHCDFRKLRSLLIRTHMLDLISTTEELHYENYRQSQMEVRKLGEGKPRKFENPKFKEEEEALRKRFTEQVKAEEARFRQWEQHVRPFPYLSAHTLLILSIAHPRTRPSQQGS